MTEGAKTGAAKPRRKAAPKAASEPPAEVVATPVARPGAAHAACANCGAGLTGPYCAQCGQNGHLHNRLVDLLHELAEGIAHFDGRLWRTLPLLALRPGELSRQWIDGKRMRYVAPLHIFLFAVFLLFLVPTLTGAHILVGKAGEAPISFNLDSAPLERAAPTVTPEQAAKANGAKAAAKDVKKYLDKFADDPKYYVNKIESLAYKLSFMVVPISIAILGLLCLGRGFTLYDHSVVTLYGLGFTALGLTLSVLLNAITPPAWGIGVIFGRVLLVVVAAHAVWHLKQAYGFSWFGAVWRGAVLAVLSLIGMLAFLSLVLALGLAG